jgi:RHS repeat-associated protein
MTMPASPPPRPPLPARRSADYAWTRNRAGQILTEGSTITNDPSNGTTTSDYDQLARLASFNRASSTTSYAWQQVPNRSSVQAGANPAVTTTYSLANWPTSDSAGGSYATDAEGRLTARPGQTLVWDDLGRLTKVKDATTQADIALHTYDALDRVITVDHGTSDVVRFRYVGLTTQVAQTVDVSSGAVLRSFANDWNGERLLDWTGTGSNQHFYGTNAHHDVTWTASDTGAVVSTLRYDPWGNLTASYGSYLPAFRFQGSWFDPTVELSWVVARWYAPGLGRFVSEDTLLGETASPRSRHLYAYGQGNPTLSWDPLGMRPEEGPMPPAATKGFWVRVQPGQNLNRLAAKYLGSSTYWPVIYNRNRAQYRQVTSPVGLCIYIEPGFAARPPSAPSCTNTPAIPITGDVAEWDQTKLAMKRLGMADTVRRWLMITPTELHDLTDKKVKRMRNPGPWEHLYYSLNTIIPDDVATSYWTGFPWGYTHGKEYCRGGSQIEKDSRNGITYIRDNPCLPAGDTRAITLGHYVFVKANVLTNGKAPEWLKAHEFIHTLEYQADLLQYRQYLDDVQKTPPVMTDCGYEVIEPIACMWGSWIRTYGDYGERPPWDVWRPI